MKQLWRHIGKNIRLGNQILDVSIEETVEAEEELIAIQNDIKLSPKFKKSYEDFWL